ncbi:MAG: helix-turn-helix domain-containing protein [Oscillospiraceae bacterium]
MNVNLLKGKMKEHALTQGEVAEKMGVSLSRFNAKLNERGGAEFSLGELQALKNILALTSRQVDQIFFT